MGHAHNSLTAQLRSEPSERTEVLATAGFDGGVTQRERSHARSGGREKRG